MLAQVRSLGRKRIDIVAEGQYPDKRSTKVADVAVYQNDGTGTITPARFVEGAAEGAGDWGDAVAAAAGKYIEGDESSLTDLGIEVSFDIGNECNRVRTGRLKKSFRPKVMDR